MATKTLILRPTSITSENTSLVTLYPSDTTMDNAHILVNEEVADDDATYITGGLGSNVSYHFNFTKPDDLKKITGFSFLIRHKFEASSAQHTITYQLYIGANNYTLKSLAGSDNPTVYTDMNENITDEIRNAIISAINDEQNTSFYITQTITGNSSKSKPIRTTQIYIEIIYENNASIIQYLKQNNTWINIGELNLYYKRNAKWSKKNDHELDRFFDKNYVTRGIE